MGILTVIGKLEMEVTLYTQCLSVDIKIMAKQNKFLKEFNIVVKNDFLLSFESVYI